MPPPFRLAVGVVDSLLPGFVGARSPATAAQLYVPFAMSNITAQTPALVREGLLEYGNFERVWSNYDEIGVTGYRMNVDDINAYLQQAREIIGDRSQSEIAFDDSVVAQVE